MVDINTEYRGKVITRQERCRIELLYSVNEQVKYLMITLKKGKVIYGILRGRQWLNGSHCCAPNSEYVEYEDPETGESNVFLHELRGLKKG